jgi:hypothetical protein
MSPRSRRTVTVSRPRESSLRFLIEAPPQTDDPCGFTTEARRHRGITEKLDSKFNENLHRALLVRPLCEFCSRLPILGQIFTAEEHRDTMSRYIAVETHQSRRRIHEKLTRGSAP